MQQVKHANARSTPTVLVPTVNKGMSKMYVLVLAISEGGINMTAAVQDLAFTTLTKKMCQISTV